MIGYGVTGIIAVYFELTWWFKKHARVYVNSIIRYLASFHEFGPNKEYILETDWKRNQVDCLWNLIMSISILYTHCMSS